MFIYFQFVYILKQTFAALPLLHFRHFNKEKKETVDALKHSIF